MKRRLPILFTILMLTLASLACQRLSQFQQADATPTAASPVSNIFMANDSAGINKTNIFAPKDEIYIFFDANQAEVGTYFEARWYVLSLPEEVDPTVPFSISSYTYEGGSTVIQAFIQSSHEDGFTPSQCKVEVYMDGVKVAEQFFTIQ